MTKTTLYEIIGVIIGSTTANSAWPSLGAYRYNEYKPIVRRISP